MRRTHLVLCKGFTPTWPDNCHDQPGILAVGFGARVLRFISTGFDWFLVLVQLASQTLGFRYKLVYLESNLASCLLYIYKIRVLRVFETGNYFGPSITKTQGVNFW